MIFDFDRDNKIMTVRCRQYTRLGIIFLGSNDCWSFMPEPTNRLPENHKLELIADKLCELNT